MATFDPKLLVAASKSTEFNGEVSKTPKTLLAAAIDTQLKLTKDLKAEGRRWVVFGENEASITLRFANKLIPIVGEETMVVVPRDQVEPALLYLKEQALAGAYDKPLADLAKDRASRTEKMRATRQQRKKEKDAAPKVDQLKS